MSDTEVRIGKGTRITFKNRHGVPIKGVVKRISSDGELVINGDDGSRYTRNVDEVIYLAGPDTDMDELTVPAGSFGGKKQLPPPSEKLKDYDVNKRFDFLSQLVRMVINNTAVSLIITGEGGLGKTYTVKKEIIRKQLSEYEDFVHIKGFSTARGLYRTLFENNGKLVVFDDCDEVIDDKVAGNLLKGALDSYDDRTIHWITKTSDESLPDSFNFTGRVIFISNYAKERVPQALLSRSLNIDLTLTRDEIVTRMEWIIKNSNDFMSTYSKVIKLECLDIIKEHVEEVRELSLRSLEKVVKIRAGEKDQLDPNDPDFATMDWKELAKFMLLS